MKKIGTTSYFNDECELLLNEKNNTYFIQLGEKLIQVSF